MTELAEDDVDKTIVGGAGNVLDDGAVDELAILDEDVLVGHVDGRWLLVVLVRNVDTLGDTHRQELLARPQWLRLEDGRRGDRSVPAGQPKQDILNGLPIAKVVSKRKLANTTERILHDAHDGFVRLGRDDL